jgi:Gram-negative porin
MWQLIQQQQTEITNLKSQLNQTETKLEQTEVKVAATADAVEQGVSLASNSKLAKLASWAEKTSIGGYGEHHFNHNEDSDDKIDAHRFVLFFGHQFTDNLRFFSELEVEHAHTGKNGKVELEQAYIEWDYAEKHSAQFGQFLIPVGILNETHEPDTFYGTERNLVEKYIVPATWWEAGVQLHGEVMPGLSYNAAVHSGLNIPVDATTPKFGIRDGRQGNSEAIAEDLAFTARLKYTGVAGLELGLTLQHQQDVTQGSAIDDASALLTEAHLTYSEGDFGLRALWAEWDIDGQDFEDEGADQQEGWYIEPSYKLTEKLGTFVRYSEYNNTAGDSSSEDNEIWQYGVNYWLHPNVVLKADVTDYVNESSGEDKDSFNLGVGWSF